MLIDLYDYISRKALNYLMTERPAFANRLGKNIE